MESAVKVHCSNLREMNGFVSDWILYYRKLPVQYVALLEVDLYNLWRTSATWSVCSQSGRRPITLRIMFVSGEAVIVINSFCRVNAVATHVLNSVGDKEWPEHAATCKSTSVRAAQAMTGLTHSLLSGSYMTEYGFSKMVGRQTPTLAHSAHPRHTMKQARLTHVAVINPKRVYLDRINVAEFVLLVCYKNTVVLINCWYFYRGFWTVRPTSNAKYSSLGLLL